MAELTTDEMSKIVVDATLGREQRVTGPEAEAFLKEVLEDIKYAEENGLQIEIPTEWPDAG